MKNNKIEAIYKFLKINNFNDELNILKRSMPRPDGAIYDIESSRRPSEEFSYTPVMEKDIRAEDMRCEEKVCWFGDGKRMIRIDVDYMYPVQGNIFYTDTMKTIQNEIEASSYSNRLRLYCGYCMISKVGRLTLEESIQYEDIGYEKLSTGDEELDRYLENEEAFREEIKDSLTPAWNESYDEEEIDAQVEQKILEIEEELAEAEKNGQGDFGKIIYQIRDGNHRSFAAKNAGEKYIWANLAENQYNDIMEGRYGYDEKFKDIREDLIKLKNKK